MSGTTEAEAILARADRARKSLRSFRFDVEIRWDVAGASTTHRVRVTFERPNRVRVVEALNLYAALFTDRHYSEQHPGGEGGGGREYGSTPGQTLAEWRIFAFPTLGQILDGKPIGPPKGAVTVRPLPATNGGVEAIAWRDPAERSEVVLTLGRVDGLPRSERRTFFGARGQPIAVATERYDFSFSGGGVNLWIPRGFFEMSFPKRPAFPFSKWDEKTPKPEIIPLALEIRRVQEESTAATAAMKSLRGVRFTNEPSGAAPLEEFAFERPGKFWRRSRLSPGKEIFRTDGKRYMHGGETPRWENLMPEGDEQWRPYLGVPSGKPDPYDAVTTQIWRTPGRFLSPETIGGVLCDVFELEGTFYFERFIIPYRISTATGRADRVVRRTIASPVDGLGIPQISAFPELILNRDIPSSVFAVPAFKPKR